MDTKPTKKMKFVPKAPGRRPPKPIVPKTEVLDDAEGSDVKDLLLRRFKEDSSGKFKDEKKFTPARVAFGKGASTSTTINRRVTDKDGKPKKEYKEPWDVESDYPVTLPLRKPDMGKPSDLDEVEFGTSYESQGFDESRMNTALELGLEDPISEPRLMLVQLPRVVPVPFMKQEGASTSKPPPSNAGPVDKRSGLLRELPAGLMGKLLVYNSGKVKLKLGDVLYDVNPGSNVKFAEDGVAINCNEKHCSNLGPIYKHMVVTPDVDSILDGLQNADLG